MSAPRRSPQVGRIARLLHVDPDEVQGLDGIPDDDLRALHDLIGHAVFAEHRPRFARVAGLSAVLPAPVAGKLAERFLPPTLAARTAEALEPARARDLVGRVSVDYLAEIALALDPTRSARVVQQIPTPRVAAVARALFARGEYAAMAEFAGTVTLDALFAALDVATARDLLEVVPLLVWNDNIARVVAEVPVTRIEELVHEIAGSDPDEIAELVDRLAPIAQRVPPERVAEVARALFAGGHHVPMALLARAVSGDGLLAAVEVATARDLLAVVPLLEWEGADVFAAVVDAVPAERLDELLREIVEGGLWVEGSALIERLHPTAADRVLHRVGAVSDGHFAAFRRAADDGLLGPAAAELLQRAEDLRGAAR